MPHYQIKHTINGRVLFECDAQSLKEAVLRAINNSADLRFANLSYADLSYANLRFANLSSANLSYADLSSADLSYADLSYADLRSADLRSADLRSADLSYANLSSANLSSANLSSADLRDLKGLATKEESTARLDQIRGIILRTPDRLDMHHWHGCNWDPEKIPDTPGECGTTHCLAGWAQALCTDPKIRKMTPPLAGAVLIPTAAHMFYVSNDRAMKFLKDREYAT